MTENRYKRIILVIILLSLAIAPSFLLGNDNRNYLLIAIMSITPLIILSNFYLNKIDLWLILFITTIIVFPELFHPESMRWSTVLYSTMFCMTFMAYYRLLFAGGLDIESYYNILKYLIYAYFVVLIIQQLCVLTGIPVFNLRNYNPEEPWKLNSLAAEPSHSARIIAILMFCFLTVKEIIIGEKYVFRANFHEDKWIWFSFLWSMSTMGSSLAFILIPLVLLKFIRFKNLLPVFGMLLLMFFITAYIDNTALNRTYKFINAILSLNMDIIIDADHSASFRIVPLFLCAREIDLTTLNGWFGNGIDFVSNFLYKIFPGIPEGTSGGGMFQFALEYGIVSFFVFTIFSFVQCYRTKDIISIIFWFMLVFMYGVNNQIVWLAIILLFTNNFFQQSYRMKQAINE